MSQVQEPVQHCPVCGARGKPVPAETLRSLLRPEALPGLPSGRFRFCSGRACDVVYFAEAGGTRYGKADLSVRVGIKETADPRPICYCFGHTLEQMLAEIALTGTTTIPDRIRAVMDTTACDCIHTNPQGTCCLGTVTALAQEHGAGRNGGRGGET